MRFLVLLVLLVVCGPVVPAAAVEWRWPVDGPPAVSRPFVAPPHRYAAGHRGADLPAVPGAPVRAAGDGVVSYAGLVAGRGVVVVVHGPLRTTYEPVSALVAPGALVSAGELIGVLDAGHLGCPQQACLHWGLRRGEDHLDPVRLVRPGPVRLLPLDGPPPVAALRSGPAEPVGGSVVGSAGDGDRRVLAPAQAPAVSVSRPADVGAAVAGASLLGAAALAATRRRRR